MSGLASYIDSADTFFVMGAAIFTSLLSEGMQTYSKQPIQGISWLLIYRHQEYKTLISNVEQLSKKIEKQKEQQIYQGAAAKNKTQDKKLQQNESLLKQYQQDLQKQRMASTFFVALFMIIFVSLLSNAYQGVVVAKLPFEPISFMRNITHRSIVGNDYTDCSMIFIYILSNVSLRPIMQKLLGLSGPRVSMAQQGFFPTQ